MVAHGLHPDNGQPYTWGEQSANDTPLAELPAVTAEQVALLIADAEALFLEHGYRRKAEPEQPRPPVTACPPRDRRTVPTR